MIKVLFTNETDTSIDKSKLEEIVKKVLLSNNFKNNIEVSVAIVDHKKIIKFAVKYMNETKKQAAGHPVLSFLKEELEEEFIDPPDGINYLGEILVSSKNTEAEIYKWVEHGALHLCGVHHD